MVTKYAVVSRGRFLVELGVALLLARLPIIGVPFNWLESYFHELSHALMTVLTGGQVSHIQLFVNGAGFCFSHGGAPIFIGLSGYLGASLWGLLLYQLTLWPKGIRWCYSLMSLLVIGSAVLWARDSLTWLILVLLAGLFILPSRFANAAWLLMLLRIIALVVMLNAILSPLVLLQYDGQG
ncbi:MAG: M50 family metallopeptidase, partial [Shewanella sp.]